jgi:transporter family protein
MNWFVLAVLDAFFAALVAIFAKVGLQGVDSNVATAVRAIVMTVFIAGFVVAIGKGPQLTQLTSKDMVFIVLSGVAGAISWLLYFAALKMADASKVAPVDRASLLFVIMLSALLLGEKITLKSAIAGTLIFVGVLLLAI